MDESNLFFMDNVLYVLGNGFDLHHGIRSSYGDFCEWLRRKRPEVFAVYESVCHYKALWSDFETSMAYVSRDYLLQNGMMLLPDLKKKSDDLTMADIMLGGDYAKEMADELLHDLRVSLHGWINGIKAPSDYHSYRLPVDTEAHFLVFNYTTFLESHYGIEREQINYIHGRKTDKWQDIVLGHGEDNDAIFDKWWKRRYGYPVRNKKGKKYYRRDAIYHAYQDEAYLPEYEMITEAVENYYQEAQKPVGKILKEQDAYFHSLSDICHIYVWGYSFANVDMPYLRKIAEVNQCPLKLRWYVSYYCEKDKERALRQLKDLKVSFDKIECMKLQDFVLR